MNKLMNILFVASVISMGYACSIGTKKVKPPEIVPDNDKAQTLIKLYHLSSPEFMDMYQVLLDTCEKRYHCTKIDAINFSVGAVGDSTKYHFTHGGGPFLFQPRNTLICLKVGHTLVFVAENQFQAHSIFKGALLIEERYLTDFKQTDYNKCLFKDQNGSKSKILFVMTFVKYKDGPPAFSLFGDYIE